MNITIVHPKFNIKLNMTLEYYERLRSLLTIKKVVGKNFVRFGKPNDGGYVMVDNFNAVGGA